MDDQEVMTNLQFITFHEFYSAFVSIASVLGILSNAVNIKTFVSMGFVDGLTVSFLALAVSDLMYLHTTCIRAVCAGFFSRELKYNYQVWYSIDPFAVYVFAGNVGMLVYLMTILITTFLAVARCMCVIRPFHFRNTFTRKRSIIILSCFAVFSILSYLPIIAMMGMNEEFDPRINATRSLLWVSADRERVKDVIWIFRDTTLTVVTQFIVVLYVVIMIRGLEKSSRFRQATTTISVTLNKTQTSTFSSSTNTLLAAENTSQYNLKYEIIGPKETRSCGSVNETSTPRDISSHEEVSAAVTNDSEDNSLENSSECVASDEKSGSANEILTPSSISYGKAYIVSTVSTTASNDEKNAGLENDEDGEGLERKINCRSLYKISTLSNSSSAIINSGTAHFDKEDKPLKGDELPSGESRSVVGNFTNNKDSCEDNQTINSAPNRDETRYKDSGDTSKQNIANESRRSTNDVNRRSTKRQSKLSVKERQVVLQVVLISIVYIVCNLPKLLLNIVGFLEADFTLGRRYKNIYVATIGAMEIFQMFNSSINFFIYYKFNPKFYSHCRCKL